MRLRNPETGIPDLQFLKLGGSLITEKGRPHTPRPEALKRLAREILAAYRSNPGLRLILGHGSGSFGHVPALKYGTRQGVKTPEEWQGFVEVWREAAALNRLVIEALGEAGLPALAFPPLASVMAENGAVLAWNLAPIAAALQAGRLPVVFGDVVFDTIKGGTILSTEDLFCHLATHFSPRRILLAGLEQGVWADYPRNTKLVPLITPDNLETAAPNLGGSATADVTGGMASKVRENLQLAKEIRGLEVLIFSGDIPGAVEKALAGAGVGTLLRAT